MSATAGLYDVAIAAHDAGLCVVPPKEDGTKAPMTAWKHFQTQRPTVAQIDEWYSTGAHSGIGFVTGAVSGNLEMLEFEDRATCEAFVALAREVGLDELVSRIATGYAELTPGGGFHLLYHCAAIAGNTKLARRPKRPDEQSDPNDTIAVTIETRGEGGYVVAAPSNGRVHPSGGAYRLVRGGVDTIATITPAERDELFALAGTFDELPAPPPREPRTAPTSDGLRPGDDFAARTDWADILEPHGWTLVFRRADETQGWRRPGKDRGISATANFKGTGPLYVFTSSTSFEANASYGKFGAFAVLNHDGDFAAAAADLRTQGFGADDRGPEPVGDDDQGAGDDRAGAQIGPRLVWRRASEIEPLPITFAWKPWIPNGMVSLFAGYGGAGKSTVALGIAAALSRGGKLPDGAVAPVANTLIFAAEDSAEHVIVPRLISLGADLKRVVIVEGTVNEDGEPGWIQLREHIEIIEPAIREHAIGLTIIDPISSFMGDANTDRESEVRALLVPLAKMAERTECAVLLVRHLSKSGGEGTRSASRVLGSTAWTDVPRAVWMLADAPDEHQPEAGEDGERDVRRVLGMAKANLTAKPPPLWCVQPAMGPLRWLGLSPVGIDECFSLKPQPVEDASGWLADYLAGGSVRAEDGKRDAKRAGHTTRTLERAKKSLGVESYQVRDKGLNAWYWKLPAGTADDVADQAEDPAAESQAATPDDPDRHSTLARGGLPDYSNKSTQTATDDDVAVWVNNGVDTPNTDTIQSIGHIGLLRRETPSVNAQSTQTATPPFTRGWRSDSGDDADPVLSPHCDSPDLCRRTGACCFPGLCREAERRAWPASA